MVTVSHILVAFDFGEPAAHALDYGKALATRWDASLDLLYVVPNPWMVESVDVYIPIFPDFLDAAVSDANTRLATVLSESERTRFRARAVVKVGDPKTEVVTYAHVEHADLIVMGTHGRTGMSHVFLGSVAERVVRAAPCPVLTVR